MRNAQSALTASSECPMYGVLVKLVLELVMLGKMRDRDEEEEDVVLMHLIREAMDIRARKKFGDQVHK